MKTLYWLDDVMDAGSRLPSATVQKNLGAALKVNVLATAMQSRSEFNKLIAGFKSEKVWAVILDYKLTGLEPTPSSASGGTGFGTSYAADIRATKPSIPVIGVSNEDPEEIPKFRMENYLEFFSRNTLTKPQPPILELKALVDGYHNVWKAFEARRESDGAETMMKLINPPNDAMEMMELAIPNELRGKWDLETPHLASRWLWHQLQGKPGFLFDSLELATHLGLNIKGFEQVKDNFAKALYKGALTCDSRPRWWVASIRGVCEKYVKHRLSGPLSNSRQELLESLGIKAQKQKDLYSTAYPRKTGIPDCVAYKSEEQEEKHRVQTLLADTVVLPDEANPPFGFEARRYYHPNDSQ